MSTITTFIIITTIIHYHYHLPSPLLSFIPFTIIIHHHDHHSAPPPSSSFTTTTINIPATIITTHLYGDNEHTQHPMYRW
jgi:hypothetical protein